MAFPRLSPWLMAAWRGEPLMDRQKFRRNVWRAILFGTVCMLVLIAQSALVYSPKLLVDALYHARHNNHKTVNAMSPEEREKFLYRLCWVNAYYRSPPGTNQYQLPDPTVCER